MAYVTWAEVAEAVEGEKRLLEILKPSGDTADDHPFFDSRVLLAQQLVDQSLRKGGWATPLDEPLTDETLKNDTIGILVGELTRAYDGRAPWMDAMEAAAKAHLKAIAEGDVTGIIGAEPETDTTQAALIAGAFDDERVWDQSSPTSPVHDVFRSIRAR